MTVLLRVSLLSVLPPWASSPLRGDPASVPFPAASPTPRPSAPSAPSAQLTLLCPP